MKKCYACNCQAGAEIAARRDVLDLRSKNSCPRCGAPVGRAFTTSRDGGAPSGLGVQRK